MGCTFSSNQLAAAPSDAIPTLSYAFSAGNTKTFGIDATYTYTYTDFPFFRPVGLITPYLVPPYPAPTITCTAFSAEETSQFLDCPVSVAALVPGLYTFSFFQYTSAASVGSDGSTTYTQVTYTDPATTNSYQEHGGAATFSIVNPQGSASTTTTITPTSTASTTITSGVSEIPASSSVTVPASIKTVTVYATTIVSTQTSRSTITGASLKTVTGTCPGKPATTLLKCNENNCLRALISKSVAASAFCSTYTKTPGLATPTYASKCSPSKLSSACSCIVQSTSVRAPKARAVFESPVYAGPDFTYGDTVTVTSTAGPLTTVTSGPIPSATITDPNSTISSGTSTSTDNEPSTVTVTIYKSSVDGRTVSTVTVAPTNCSD